MIRVDISDVSPSEKALIEGSVLKGSENNTNIIFLNSSPVYDRSPSNSSVTSSSNSPNFDAFLSNDKRIRCFSKKQRRQQLHRF